MGEADMNFEQSEKALVFGKETFIPKVSVDENGEKEVFAICLKSDDENLLVPMKVYKIKLRGKRVLVIDEENEPAVYPADFFLVLSLSPKAENVLAEITG